MGENQIPSEGGNFQPSRAIRVHFTVFPCLQRIQMLCNGFSSREHYTSCPYRQRNQPREVIRCYYFSSFSEFYNLLFQCRVACKDTFLHDRIFCLSRCGARRLFYLEGHAPSLPREGPLFILDDDGYVEISSRSHVMKGECLLRFEGRSSPYVNVSTTFEETKGKSLFPS